MKCWICEDPLWKQNDDTAVAMCPSLGKPVCKVHAEWCEGYGHSAVPLINREAKQTA